MLRRILLVSACVLLPWGVLGRQAAPPKAKSPSHAVSSATADITNLLDAKVNAEWKAMEK